MDFQRNNLDRAASPYLQQHQDNPVHWQEWNPEVLAYAREKQKLVFVSIGYATCHWCHVMARDAFSNSIVATYLNEQFISIKVDREQRPDIDSYFMNFIQQTQGGGGWPLNVVLTPDGKPFFAGTFFPSADRDSRPGLTTALKQVSDWYNKHRDGIQMFEVALQKPPANVSGVDQLVTAIMRSIDVYGGFGQGTKFPPHCTLWFLLHEYATVPQPAIKTVIIKTLDAMAQRGLHDHLQGGFFRYCVDREWTIPHFEKMLYDQAMMLWIYSAAYHVFRRPADKAVVENIVRSLDETFLADDLFYSAHDADTNHIEGETYIWSYNQLRQVLNAGEWLRFNEVYEISPNGNFEGRNHLVKTGAESLPGIEKKLLTIRRTRPQPFIDRKIVTSWNALTGIGFLLADRWVGLASVKGRAEKIFHNLSSVNSQNGYHVHSSLNGQAQQEGFLEDSAAMLLLATYLHEDGVDMPQQIIQLRQRVLEFKTGTRWFTNLPTPDFPRTPAEEYDHPTPSPVSLATMALQRANLILSEEPDATTLPWKHPLVQDCFNTVTLMSRGNLHEIHGPRMIDWGQLPLQSSQLRSPEWQDCTGFACHRYANEDDLLSSFSHGGRLAGTPNLVRSVSGV